VAQRRDLVVRLTWQAGRSGAADLELEVAEPSGGVCSSAQRQSAGGGAWTATLVPEGARWGSGQGPSSAYAAAEAYPGEYKVTIRRVWGEPLGGRCRLEVIQHQGTPNETRRLETVRLDGKSAVLKFTLKEGRRTQPAEVTAAAAVRREDLKDEQVKERRILTRLREVADPLYVSGPPVRLSASAGVAPRQPTPWSRPNSAMGAGPAPPTGAALEAAKARERLAFQTAVPQRGGSGVSLAATASVAPDQSYVRVRLNPQFQSGPEGTASRPRGGLGVIPGGE
jgi:hypothetical protein